MLHLTAALDPASGVPLYEQLYRSIAAEISAGTLPAGARMPGKRSLAEGGWRWPVRTWLRPPS